MHLHLVSPCSRAAESPGQRCRTGRKENRVLSEQLEEPKSVNADEGNLFIS